MVSIANGTTYVTAYNFYAQKLDMYYANEWVTIGFQFLLTLSSQYLGVGFAGVLRRLVVYPERSIWPTVLPTLALNRALLKAEIKQNINGWTISRYRFFFIVFLCSFVYFWLPDYLFQAPSSFNWITWISPNNFNLAAITGTFYGMGLNPVTTFDWNIISYSQPLKVPFYSLANQYVGSLIGLFIIPALFWTNYKWSAYIPMNSNALFTNTGERFQIKQVLTMVYWMKQSIKAIHLLFTLLEIF